MQTVTEMSKIFKEITSNITQNNLNIFSLLTFITYYVQTHDASSKKENRKSLSISNQTVHLSLKNVHTLSKTFSWSTDFLAFIRVIL